MQTALEEVLAEDEELCSHFSSTCISTCWAVLHFMFVLSIKPGPCLGWAVNRFKKKGKNIEKTMSNMKCNNFFVLKVSQLLTFINTVQSNRNYKVPPGFYQKV